MKKRSTKKSRNDDARKKTRKIKRMKTGKRPEILIEPKKVDFLRRKAVFIYSLAAISCFSFNFQTIKPHFFLKPCQYLVSQKTTLDCSPWDKLPNHYKLVKKCDLSKQKISYSALHKKISPILKNTPMEIMTGEIAKRDQPVAALLVGIAMKESKFGRYSPKKNSKDCYNYWGYRGKENTTASGYSCFDSPEHAVKVVGNRIGSMVKRGAKTPADMISWKCGSTCAGHDPVSVKKWISDVAINYYKINPPVQIARK
jgi:hypothetical protein